MGCCCSSCREPDIEPSTNPSEIKQGCSERPGVTRPTQPRAPERPKAPERPRAPEQPKAPRPPQVLATPLVDLVPLRNLVPLVNTTPSANAIPSAKAIPSANAIPSADAIRSADATPSANATTSAIPSMPQVWLPQDSPIDRSSDVSAPSTLYSDDEPPSYDSSAVQNDTQFSSASAWRDTAGATAAQEPRELPYVIPLTSAGAGASSEDSLAAAYAADMQSLGIPQNQYLAFLAGLDSGLFASPTGQPGSVSAYIHSMFQDQNTTQDVHWHSTTTTNSISRSKAYVMEKNADIFHKASLHVEVLQTDDMKRAVDDASEASLMMAEGDKKLNDIEAKRLKQTLKLEKRLLTSKTLEKQQKAMRKFLEKDDKYNRKALKVIAKTEEEVDKDARSKGRAETTSDDGVFWLLVTKFRGSSV